MEENKTKSVSLDPVSTAVYKWIKISQSIILRVLGVIFFVLGRRSKDGGIKVEALSYSLGVVFAVYGIRNLLSGYLLNRNVTNGDVLFGLRGISFSLVLFCKTEIITERFPIFLIAFFYSLSARRIVSGVDHVIGKGVKKSISKGVFIFIGSALLIAGTSVYVYFYSKNNGDLFRFVLRILGVLVFVFGLVSGILLLVRVHNTKKLRKEESFVQPAPRENRSTEVKNKDVKVISLTDLKKKGRKGTNKAGYQPIEDEKKQIEDTKEEAEKKEEDNPEEPKPENDEPTATFEAKDEENKEEQQPKGKKKKNRK